MFIHLHNHSAFSFLEGAFTIPQFLTQIERMETSAIALTDTNGLYGAIPFYKFAKQLGVKPILGCCLQSTEGEAVVIAKNRKGFSQLCSLITLRHLQDGFSLIHSLKCLANDSNHELFILSRDERLLISISQFWDPQSLYAELVRSQQKGNTKEIMTLRVLASKLGIRVVATNNVHFLFPEDHFIHRLFGAIRERTRIYSHRLSLVSSEQWLKPAHQMEDLFSDIPEALLNTKIIAEECNLELELGKRSFPRSNYPSELMTSEYLENLCKKGILSRFGKITCAQQERLRHELKIINDLGFGEYFLVVNDILEFARKNRIHWIGRGSAACSLVSFALGITNIDPIRYDLFFERFLNPERTDAPDIDLDFGWKRRDEILEYVYQRYGEDKVAMISTYTTYGPKLAVREIGKAFGLPEKEITSISSRIPVDVSISTIIRDKNRFPETREMWIEKEPLSTIFQLAAHVQNYPRNLSLHAGGIVISPGPLTEIVPLQKSSKGPIMTQYDMYGVQDVGLVKIDLLAQRSLSVFDDVLEALQVEGKRIPEIYDYDFLYASPVLNCNLFRGDTVGCFYIESPAMRGLLQKLNVASFEDLTAASSVIRPGVAESGMLQEYIRRKRGEETIRFLHPKMETILKETCGVMIYQEDVIRVAHEVIGMSLVEADLLRRAMSGKDRSEYAMEQMEDDFLKKAIQNRVDFPVAKEIWEKISTFAAYAFCKAHSSSYAQLSYQMLFLKLHYPAHFMAAVLSNQGGFYSTMTYVEEARRMGLKILLPDVLKGEFEYHAVGPDAIRLGLMQIKGISAESWKSFFEERKKRPYEDFNDFVLRSGLHKNEIEILIKCGACDSFGLTRPQLLWLMKATVSSSRKAETSFDLIGNKMIRVPQIPVLREYSEKEKLMWEMKLLDVAVTNHPLEYYCPWQKWKQSIPARMISDHKNQMVSVIGWHVHSKSTNTSKQDPMLFVSFEDTEALFETTFFPKTYRSYGHLFVDKGPYLVTGKVEEDHGVCTINVEKLEHY
jgi:DNA-directed DNA polymerase III PolC